MEQAERAICVVLDEGKAQGEFDPEIPTAVMLTTFFALLSPKGYVALTEKQQLSSEDAARYVANALSPAQVVRVTVDEDTKTATVVVPERSTS